MDISTFSIVAMAVFFIALWVYRHGWMAYTDSVTYLLMAGGTRVASPFRWRWFIPGLLSAYVPRNPPFRPRDAAPVLEWVGRDVFLIWSAISWASLITCAGLIANQTEHAGAPGWIGAWLFCTIPWYRILSMGPFMTDQLGMMCTLLVIGKPLKFSIPLVILGGVTHERSAVFAALFDWNPWLLIGIIVPTIVAIVCKPGPCQPYEIGWVDRPLTSAVEFHRTFPAWSYVFPWGLCLLGVEATWTMALIAAVAYGQMLMARDRHRLYQWMAPALIPRASKVLAQLPQPWLLIALLVHAFSPIMDPNEVGRVPWSIDPEKPKT